MVRLVLGGRTARAPLREMLAATAGVEFVEADDMDAIIAETTRADALILSDPRGPDGARLAVALNGSGCRVKWVQMVSAGYDGIASHPLPTGLVLTNQGGVMAGSVAEHALALILALHRALPAAFDLQRAGRWERERIRPTLRTLDGASVVIVGVGHVGGALAKLLAPLGAHVVGVTRDGAMRDGFEQVYPIAALDDALALADVVAICLPGTAETRGLFSRQRIAAIKAGATLVNVGRGETVDAAALAAALSGGHLRGAGLDVTEPEPLPHDHPLWRAPNLIVTPHVAGGGNPQSGRRIAAMVGENLSRFIAGEPLLNRVRANGA